MTDTPTTDRPVALTSHELADRLLARRDNDVMVDVVDEGSGDTDTFQPYAVQYKPAGDQVVILARRENR